MVEILFWIGKADWQILCVIKEGGGNVVEIVCWRVKGEGRDYVLISMLTPSSFYAFMLR